MMRSFSLATLLLVMVIAAVGLSSVRQVIVRLTTGTSAETGELLGLLFVGGVAGAIFGTALAIWSGDGPVRAIARIAGGASLGVAAAAQLSVQVAWPTVFMAPLVLVACVIVAAGVRRRRMSAQNRANA